MTETEFENLLRVWGYAFGPHRAQFTDPALTGYGDSPLSRIGQTHIIRRTTTMDRGGTDRRMAMGAAAGLLADDGSTRPVPRWAADRVSFTETRTARAKLLTLGDQDFAPEVLQVERAAKALQRADDLLGRVMRAEYCTLGSQGQKGRRFELSRNAYRERVAEARGWMRRELAA